MDVCSHEDPDPFRSRIFPAFWHPKVLSPLTRNNDIIQEIIPPYFASTWSHPQSSNSSLSLFFVIIVCLMEPDQAYIFVFFDTLHCWYSRCRHLTPTELSMILKLTKEPRQQAVFLHFVFFPVDVNPIKHARVPQNGTDLSEVLFTRERHGSFWDLFRSVPLLDHLFEGSSFWTGSKQIRTDPVWTQALSVPVSGTIYSGSEQFRSRVNGA